MILSEGEKNRIRGLHGMPLIKEQITMKCSPCPSSTRFPAVVNPTCGMRIKCDGRPCGDKDYFGGCCDKAKEGTYKLFNGTGQASCNCYTVVDMKHCQGLKA